MDLSIEKYIVRTYFHVYSYDFGKKGLIIELLLYIDTYPFFFGL